MSEQMKDTAAGFLAGQSAQAGTIGYHEGVCPTLKGAASGTNQVPAVLYESHPNDSRVTEAGELCPTIARRWGTGGGNTPIVGEFMAVQLVGDRDNPSIGVSDVAYALTANAQSKAQSVLVDVEPRCTEIETIGFSCKDHGQDAMKELSPTLRAMNSVNSHISGGGQVAIMTNDVIPIHDQATRHAGRNGDKMMGKGNGLGIGNEGDPCPTLTKGDKHAVFISSPADGKEYANTLRSGGDGGVPSSRGENVVMEVETGQGWWKEDTVAGTLRVEGENRPSRPSNVVMESVAINHDSNENSNIDIAGTLDRPSGGSQNVVMHDESKNIYQNQQGSVYESDLSGTLTNPGGSVGQGYKAVRTGMTLRRLMPDECAILQGFPVDWGKWGIDENGGKVKMSDSTQYKFYGNAVSCTVTKFIADALMKVLIDIDHGK